MKKYMKFNKSGSGVIVQGIPGIFQKGIPIEISNDDFKVLKKIDGFEEITKKQFDNFHKSKKIVRSRDIVEGEKDGS